MEKKNIIIGIITVAIIIIVLISWMLMADHGIEDRWIIESWDMSNDDLNLYQNFSTDGSTWWNFKSNGELIRSNDVSDIIESTYWKYTGDNEITITKTMAYMISNNSYNDVRVYEYSIENDTLTLTTKDSDSFTLMQTRIVFHRA